MRVVKLQDITVAQLQQVAVDDVLIESIVNCERQDLGEFEFSIIEHDGNVIVVDKETVDGNELAGVLESDLSIDWFDQFIDGATWHTFSLPDLYQMLKAINNPIDVVIEHHMLTVADILLGM